MKLINKLFAAFVLFGISGAAFGYDFTFNNFTEEPITVLAKDNTGSESQAVVIQPDGAHTFSFPGNNCLESMLINGRQTPISGPFPNRGTCRNVTLQVIEDYKYGGSRPIILLAG